MGIGRIVLLDFDGIEDLNLDRLLHATKRDIGFSKVAILARCSGKCNGTTVQGVALEIGVTEPDGFRTLDCDILFSCVDRPWPRHVLNFIAYAHRIPVIDGGVMVTSRGGPALPTCRYACSYRRLRATLSRMSRPIRFRSRLGRARRLLGQTVIHSRPARRTRLQSERKRVCLRTNGSFARSAANDLNGSWTIGNRERRRSNVSLSHWPN